MRLSFASKTVDQISAIVSAARAKTGRMLLTRLDQPKYEELLARQSSELDYDPLSRTALPWPTPPGASHCAGGDRHGWDLRLAGWSRGRAGFFSLRGPAVPRICGCRSRRPLAPPGADRREIRSSPIVIVAAGMDAALISVVGGLVSSVVVALPTSVGYGVAQGGATALHAALASCAPGIVVVNIDNGYGAACAALRISRAVAG